MMVKEGSNIQRERFKFRSPEILRRINTSYMAALDKSGVYTGDEDLHKKDWKLVYSQ